MAALQQLNTPVRFVPMMRCHSSCGISAIGTPTPTPAQLTSTSRPPNFAITVSIARSTDAASRTSHVMPTARVMADSACSALTTPSAVVPVIATLSPALSSASATA